MEQLFEKFRKRLEFTSLNFTRSLMDEIRWDARLIGIKGSRGTGKTTLLLQHIKKKLPIDHTVLYASLDNIWFSENRLADLADQFVKQGGVRLYLDEVHKYPNWSQEIKNLYDDHPELHIVFTGSSLLEILDARADLSRRAAVYSMQGLSFREYLNFVAETEFESYSLHQIVTGHSEISSRILKKIKPLEYFYRYLKGGYFPFFKEVPELYHSRIEEILNMIIEIELPLLRGVDIAYSSKLKQLLWVIAESAPFKPNISKLSERIGINRTTLLSYLHYLQEAGIIKNLYKQVKGISRLQKPDKIYLENPNLMHTFKITSADIGNVRETYFLNQLSAKHAVSYPKTTDFLVDGSYLFEIGGKNKKAQTSNPETELPFYFALDQVEYGHQNRIPLWLFGFLY